jgi:hypothetical protein
VLTRGQIHLERKSGLMRILMTQRALTHWGGTEMITIEVANELRRRGHEVAVFSPRIGTPASLVQTNGVWVKTRLSEIPWTPDIIHGHHHLQAMAAISYFVETPAIFCSHGVLPWPEQVPIHHRICKYVVMCEGMVARLEPIYGVQRSLIAVVPNFVNTRRFSTVRQPSARLARALLFGGPAFSPEELARIGAACAQYGLSLDKIGYAYGNPQPRPETFLPNYDLVFAIGRCALEALASGCALIPLVPDQPGHLVTPDNFDDWACTNFAPRHFRSGVQVGSDWLAGELARYTPEVVKQVTQHVRTTRSLEQAVDQFEMIHANAIEQYRQSANKPLGEFAPYLEKLSTEVDIMLNQEAEVERLRTLLSSRDKHIQELEQHMLLLHKSSIMFNISKIIFGITIKARKVSLQLWQPSPHSDPSP